MFGPVSKSALACLCIYLRSKPPNGVIDCTGSFTLAKERWQATEMHRNCISFGLLPLLAASLATAGPIDRSSCLAAHVQQLDQLTYLCTKRDTVSDDVSRRLTVGSCNCCCFFQAVSILIHVQAVNMNTSLLSYPYQWCHLALCRCTTLYHCVEMTVEAQLPK